MRFVKEGMGQVGWSSYSRMVLCGSYVVTKFGSGGKATAEDRHTIRQDITLHWQIAFVENETLQGSQEGSASDGYGASGNFLFF